ncbi:DUF1634 domain-containing protein [Achromobacter sp. NPDC058515]|uniref:DUF1634 domain-containing protein n=1 Tax=Achromobacter sp. NPDC058515 TaxID=3346533 RepID=UPI00365B365B
MKPGSDNVDRTEQVIAGLLWHGTWFACALVAAGVLLTAAAPFAAALALPWSGYDVVKAGVAMFILLPVARVALMLAIFLRERDYVYTAIAGLVLAIIAVGVAIEI